MSTTKRPGSRSSTKKKEPARKPKPAATRRAAAPEPKKAARPSKPERSAKPEKAGKVSKLEKPDKSGKPEKPVTIETPEKPAKIEVAAPEPAPKKTSRSKKATVVEAPPPPPRPVYDLNGPIPPEGAAYPPKVGALLGVAQKTLGIKTFRPGQAEAFEHLIEGEDLLAVMPTGSGKSLLYQLTSQVVPGVTVVVSPLIALIKDQLDKMVAKGVNAAKIDSTLTVKQRREVDALIRSPGGKLLLTTPERMADPEFRVFLREACGGIGVSRFVVDEAHCVSQWGHDFRPAYLSLRKALEDVGRPPVLATTATAPPHVRDDILFQLGIEGATTVTTTFDRPNLHYEVIVFSDEDEKMRTLVTLLKKLPRPGIVYCATVKKVEELYESLSRWGIPVGKYHGRMNKKERDESQNKFMEASDLVMIATNAFGLGVDKANIRNVIHYHVPGSLEAYAQEAGRGGRDGRPARCLLLFSPDDVAIQEYFLSGTYPTKRQVRMVYDALEAFTDLHKQGGHLAEDSPPTVVNIAMSSSVGQQRTRTVLSLLKDEHFIVEKEGGLYFIADPPAEREELMERAKQYEARRIADRQRLDSLLGYVKAPGCRSQVILSYLGEPSPPKCGRCDNCLRSREAALAASTEATRFSASLTRQLDEEPVEIKPRREIKARVVRIDQPAPNLPAAQGSAEAPAVSGPAAALAPKPATVLRRSSTTAAGVAPATQPKSSNGHSAAVAAVAAAAAAPAPAVVTRKKPAPELKDGELEDQVEDDEDDDDEDDDDLVGEDDEDFDDEDDDGDDEDDDEDDDDDDEEDDDDYEVIDKTAAELAEEGVEGPGEITVLARKKVPKVPKVRPLRADEDSSSSASAAEARRRRRRRRRKRRAMLPPKSAFMTPVLSTAAPIPEAQPRRPGGGGGGPVIEYVRGPMRIAAAPVASANPNDAGVGNRNRRGKKTRRWEGGGGGGRGGGGGGFDRPRFDRGPRPEGPRPPRDPQAQAGGPPGQPGVNGEPGERRRRRRRRRRGPGGVGPNGQPMLAAGPNGEPSSAPVSVFEVRGPSPQGGGGGGNGPRDEGPPMLGPDGQPLRKRRRRRRRGRGGRQREWRGAQGGGEGGGGAPPSEGGDGGGGGGGGVSDGSSTS